MKPTNNDSVANTTAGTGSTTIGAGAKTANNNLPTYEDHPIAAMFPAMEEKELAEMADDIMKNGLREPIVIYEGKILDGRHRYRACILKDLPFRTTLFDGESPVKFVWSINRCRRHLTPSQLAALAVESLPLLEADAKERQRCHGGTAPGRTKVESAKLREVLQASAADDGGEQPNGGGEVGTGFKAAEAAAKMAGVSTRSVEMAKAVKKNDPAKFNEVKEGKTTLNKAAKKVKQDRISEKSWTLMEQLNGKTFDLIHGDLERLKNFSRAELDCVLDEASSSDSVLLVTVANDTIPPSSFGPYQFRTGIVLQSKKSLFIEDLLDIYVYHRLLSIYTKGKGIKPKESLASVVDDGNPAEMIHTWFETASKLMIGGSSAPKGWEVLLGPPAEKGGLGHRPSTSKAAK